MSIFLETVKGIFSQNNPPKPNAKPLFNPATGRALQVWVRIRMVSGRRKGGKQ